MTQKSCSPPFGLSKGIQMVSLDAIIANPHQPRKEFQESELQDLADSIARVGLLQPPVVREVQENNGVHFELVAGERRVRACKLLGYSSIPAYVYGSEAINEEWQAESALIENIQRVDLNPIETALAIDRLMTLQKLTQEEIAVKVGKKRSTISNYLRLLKLPHSIQDSIRKGAIPLAHAKVLLSCPNDHSLKKLAGHIIRGEWSVKKCEEYVKSLMIEDDSSLPQALIKGAGKELQHDIFLEEICRRLEYQLGSKVEILASGKRGRIIIHYGSQDHLDSLLEKLQLDLDSP